MALFISFAETAAAAEAAAAAASAAQGAAALGTGAGALSTALGPTAAAATETTLTQFPQLAASMQAASAPAASEAMQMAGQGIMQGAAPPVAGAPALTPGAVPGAEGVSAATPIAPAGSGYPMPTATMGEAIPSPTVEVPGAPLPNAADTFRAAQGITQAPVEPLGNVGPTMPASAPNLPGNLTNLASNVPVEQTAATGEGGILNGLQRGFNTALDFASKGWEEYKKAPAAAQYLGAGYAAKKLGLFDQKQPEGKKQYKPTDMSGFRPSVPPFAPTGRTGYADGGPVETMSNMNATGGNMYYPMAQQPRMAYINPGIQNPVSQNVLDVGEGGRLDPYTGMPAFASGGAADLPDYKKMMEGKSPDELDRDARRAKATAEAGGFGIIPRSRAQNLSSPGTAAHAEMLAMMKKYGIKSALPKIKDPMGGGMADVEEAAGGGIMYGLGGYSDGGRLLKGPGDGVSDSIPASIGGRQPARLADGEFVVPARIVSELGNGSTEAGARKLYSMMDRVQAGRKKSVGKGKVAVDSKADKHLPA